MCRGTTRAEAFVYPRPAVWRGVRRAERGAGAGLYENWGKRMIALAVEFRIDQEPTETGWFCEQRLASEPSIIAEPL